MSAAGAGARPGKAGVRALLLDLYQLTMAKSYFDEGMHLRPATFSLYGRRLPSGWGYLVAAGLEDVLDYLERFAFGEDDLAYLERTGLFTAEFLACLRDLRFTGDVRAMPEGTAFFPDEPLLARVRVPPHDHRPELPRVEARGGELPAVRAERHRPGALADHDRAAEPAHLPPAPDLPDREQ